ncbi:MAG: LysR family transcriptional regulator [Burkholderiales bacterium]|jgi:DNA-binding transcriptional LysR family regulator|nr:LysR family transcriptional regulator [Burkholderiales bacterium]
MRLSLDALLVIDAIDRKGSFAAAAHELHRVPSAITYTVQKLEEDLDVLLFDRRGHRAKLTPAGHELLNEGRHLLHAAVDLESRVKRVATGWEAELRIAFDGLIPPTVMLELARDFHAETTSTRLRFSTEVLGGCWDALASGRADLAIGASGDGPAGGGYQTRTLGEIDWVFAIAPTHPLAAAAEPLTRDDILKHRAITVADSSRNLPPRTTGLISGQETLTVFDTASKLQAQVMGLGVGYLPQCLAATVAAKGELVIRRTEEPKVSQMLYVAWRTTHRGKALKWFVEQVSAKGWLDRALQTCVAESSRSVS